MHIGKESVPADDENVYGGIILQRPFDNDDDVSKMLSVNDK